MIHENKEYLQSVIPILAAFLLSTLQLTLHPNKIYLQHYSKGVKYLGAVIKPHRIYVANRTKGNYHNAIEKQNQIARDHKPTKEEQHALVFRHYETLQNVQTEKRNGKCQVSQGYCVTTHRLS
ncbi:MAG: hypothetical protein RBR35_10125 [Salinivirgaceae bacterium]|nr:hypothetical protein [Salinivirgaceae bacterium]